MSDAVLIALMTTAVGAFGGLLGALWRRLERLDAQSDQLLQENGELRAQVADLKDDLLRERQERERERQEYRHRIRRLEEENLILRSALRANGIHVEQQPTSE